MCDVCRYFEGWTVGDALGARVPLSRLVFINEHGLFEEVDKVTLGGVLYTDYWAPFQEGPEPEGDRPPAVINEGLAGEGHLVCFDRDTGGFPKAVPLSWKYGIRVRVAREFILKGKV